MSCLPQIAIVTPSYNSGRYIGETIRSVLAQSYRNYNYMVMDGGSTDATLDVLRSFDPQIHWVSQKDKGQSDAIRRGFDRVGGEILGWLNADDLLAPDALQIVAEFFAAHPEVDMVYGNANYVDAQGRSIGPCVHVEPFNRFRLFRYSDFIVQPAAFFRRAAYEAVGGLDPSLCYGMDYDLWLKLAREHSIAYLPRHLASYRWLTENKTAVGGIGRLDELRELVARHGCSEPAFLRLERVNWFVRKSFSALGRGAIVKSCNLMGHAIGTLLGSRRAVWSMVQPHTWRVIWMGQVLRARAARMQRTREREAEELVTKVTSPAKEE